MNWFRLLSFGLVLSQLSSILAIVDDDKDEHTYYFLAVSGGLQDGFPDHIKMDFRSEEEYVPAIFIGKALVRGTKSFLDVMQSGWRQYSPEPLQPLINSVVMVSGCHEHANQYWVYAVDSRQLLTVLNNEPRFLAITPDTGLIDLTVAETSEIVKQLGSYEISKRGMTNTNQIALPIVVTTYYHDSFIPSPVIGYTADGSAVTNFPESLAVWANVNDSDRTAGCDDTDNQICAASHETIKAQRRYWEGIRHAIRSAENEPQLSVEEWKANGPPFKCKNYTRLGVDEHTLRINYAFTPAEIKRVFNDYHVDFNKATIER